MDKKLKKADIITGIKVGDLVTDRISGEVVKVTYINKSFIDGIAIDNIKSRGAFDSLERQLGMSDIVKNKKD